MELTQTIADQLQARGIDPTLAAQYGCSTAVSDNGGEALQIPFFRNGECVNIKYRTLDGTKRFWQTKGGIQCLWNEDCLRDDTLIDQPLIITEGELDALAVLQAGFKRVVSVPGGAPSKPTAENSSRFRFLEEIKNLISIERVQRIILAVDGDEPGTVLMHDLANRLGRPRCQFITYPKNPNDSTLRLKDLNETLLHFGERGVRITLERAQWLRVDGVFRMGELPPLPTVPIYDIGIPSLSDHYKIRLGDFAVWTGIPSHGKSSLVNDVCCRVAKKHGLKVAFASFEQTPQRDHQRNLRTWALGKPIAYADNYELSNADNWIDEHFAFLVPSEDDDVTLDWLLSKLEAAVIQHGCKIVVIDPWNELDHARTQYESITEYTGRAIKALKRFARKFCVHLIVVAHPAKQQKDERGEYRVPTLYDISDSAHWYNKADLGVVVHRYPEHTLVRVAKSRYHDEIGVPGEVECNFRFTERRFEVLVNSSQGALGDKAA